MTRETYILGDPLSPERLNANSLAPEVRTGTFSIAYPSANNSDGVATVTYSSPLPAAAHSITYEALGPTNGNIAVNNYRTASSSTGFEIRGRRGGPATITYSYTAVYYHGDL